MQRDLTVGARSQTMTALFELPLNGFIAVEFSVHDDPSKFVLAGDGLIAGCEINDAQPRMPEGDALVGRNPMTLAIRPAMIQTLGGPLHNSRRDRITTREESDNSAHWGSS
jgi:hypothetical protein